MATLTSKDPEQLLLQDQPTTTTILQPPSHIPRQSSIEWKVCCSQTNQHALKYIIQVTMGSIVMIFCMCMIVIDDEMDDKSIYYSLLSGTLGYFLPHPSLE